MCVDVSVCLGYPESGHGRIRVPIAAVESHGADAPVTAATSASRTPSEKASSGTARLRLTATVDAARPMCPKFTVSINNIA